MSEAPDRKPCDCGMPERCAADSNVPVEFDAEMNEYWLWCRDDNNVLLMRFCFWCGGALPESKADAFFTEPSEEDVADVQRLLAGAEMARDALLVLGPPDETFDEPCGSEQTPGEPPIPFKHAYRYSTKWPTLELTIHEYPDGRFGFGWGGRYLGSPDERDDDRRKGDLRK